MTQNVTVGRGCLKIGEKVLYEPQTPTDNLGAKTQIYNPSSAKLTQASPNFYYV